MSKLTEFVVALIILHLATLTGLASDPTPRELFDQRILPIFRSPNPSSCVQCHLSSVDIKNYILPSADATFVSLRDQGLIDLDSPSDSKIFTLIQMGEKDSDDAAKLIHEKTRTAELAAFTAWISACCKDDRLRTLPTSTALARPEVSDDVIRHARKSRVVDSFVRNVWSQRMRCFPCHTPHEVDPENPKHQAAIKTRKQFEEKYGPEMMKRLELFQETPEATLAYLVESSRSTPKDRLPLLDLNQASQSLLLLKPMSKLPVQIEKGKFEDPSYLPPVTHMGGLKLHRDDQSYKSIVSWIRDYANVVHGKYTSVEELPSDNWHPSQLVVRVKQAPDTWNVGDSVQLFLHDWNSEKDTWREEPIAFTQGLVTPRHMVNGVLFMLGTAGAETDGRLPTGRYLVKAYWDSKHKIADDPTVMLTHSDYFGEAEIPKARWREGFKFAETIEGNKLVKSGN